MTAISGHQTHHLLLFGVKIETLIQGAAVLMDVLLLIPHILCILHHLLLNVTKQTDKKKKNKSPQGILLHKAVSQKRTLGAGLKKKVKLTRL